MMSQTRSNLLYECKKESNFHLKLYNLLLEIKEAILPVLVDMIDVIIFSYSIGEHVMIVMFKLPPSY